jgi:uncharacterized cupredoxin-like copper-binding protein
MRTYQVIALAALLNLLLLPTSGQAADLSRQDPIEMVVELGTDGFFGSELVFTPNKLSFETGKLYKLILKNPSKDKHYFSALRFAAAVWTRKVETESSEIKGAVREIELKPGGAAEWFFVPVQAGTFGLECTIPGHAKAGMVGQITVQ